MKRASPLAAADVEVFQSLFSSVAEEMGVVLMRSSASPNIKERLDFSCALFTAEGELFAQAAHIPVHLGSAPLSVRAAMRRHTFRPGDAIVLNDPYQGGTHLPDITLVSPVFLGANTPSLYVATRAHHADVGGYQPGSMASCPDVFGEGLRLPPVRLLLRDQPVPEVWDVLLANVRTPVERRIDLLAQCAANRRGVARLEELAASFGRPGLLGAAEQLLTYGERRMRALLAALPDRTVRAQDVLDDDGQGRTDLVLNVALRVQGERATLDFAGTAEQSFGSLNANPAITWSAVLYCFQCLLGEDVPPNEGMGRPLDLVLPKGSLVDPHEGAAIAGGNVETSQRLVDLVFAALAQLAPDRIPAASQGTMNNLTIGRSGVGAFTYYETTAGGAGAGPRREGAGGLQVHMTNTRNTPIEALELAYPLRVVETRLAPSTGGAGRHRGGDGVVRVIELLAPARISVLSERRTHAPPGRAGGEDGAKGRNWIRRRGGDEESRPGKFSEALGVGDQVGVQSPGGGGYGRPGASQGSKPGRGVRRRKV